MTITIHTHWKLLVELADDSLSSLPILFNEHTGRSFIRTLGGRTNFAFSPATLSCTTQFYAWLRATYEMLGYEGKKFPFKHIDTGIVVNFQFRLYGNNLLIIEVDRRSLPIECDSDLLKISSLWEDSSLRDLVLSVIGLISRPGRNFKPASNKPKVYSCNYLIGPPDELPAVERLIELLTRHRSPSSRITDIVLKKNCDLQVDASTLLVDRQGVVASYPSDISTDQTVRRRFTASCNSLELIACVERMIERGTLRSLENAEISDLSLYFGSPETRFIHSTSSMFIWKQLATEFGLTAERWKTMEKETGINRFVERSEPVILIVTALPEESSPMLTKIHSVSTESIGGFYINRGKFILDADKSATIYVFPVGTGNTKAALNTAKMLDTLRPDLTVFCGIAGGRKEAVIGSVVIANLVYYYESGKEGKQGFSPRPRTLTLSPRTESLASAFVAKVKNTDKPYDCFFKPIACGEKVLGTSKGSSASLVANTYGDALAVEMEGFGFLSAFEGSHFPGILVRGISDRLDKKTEEENHELAECNATDLTIKLIEFFLSVVPATRTGTSSSL